MIKCLLDITDFSVLEQKFSHNSPAIAEQIDIRKELLSSALMIAYSELRDPSSSGKSELYVTSQEIVNNSVESVEWADPYGLISDACMFEMFDAPYALSIEQIYNYAYQTCREHFASNCRRWQIEKLNWIKPELLAIYLISK